MIYFLKFIRNREYMQQRLGLLSTPIFILSLTLLLINDFYLKAAFPSFLTGKLSDFSGLIVFYGVFSLFFRIRIRNIFIISILFTVWKSHLSEPVIELFNQYMFYNISRVVDYTDLFALISLPIFHIYLSRNKTKNLPMAYAYAIFLISIFSIVGTSKVNQVVQQNYKDHVIEYSYKDDSVKYFINDSIDSLVSKYKHKNYHVSDSYHIKPWEGTVHYFSPPDRCSNHFALNEPATKNKFFDGAKMKLISTGQGTKIRLFSLTVCHEAIPIGKEAAIAEFERYFLEDTNYRKSE